MIDSEPMTIEEERDRYRAALLRITKNEGKVCAQFEVCEHRACNSSYAAWAIADEALTAWPTSRIGPS